ncbi:unnamed protein product [Gongylonema pulchrum]|uniref:Transposase n=1 Tax=Gongylonema pulchrum TaxID=637853 RepID=A0A183DFF6_9BILA|nr:unnamed protein product [Gongylonema pulchrum]
MDRYGAMQHSIRYYAGQQLLLIRVSRYPVHHSKDSILRV